MADMKHERKIENVHRQPQRCALAQPIGMTVPCLCHSPDLKVSGVCSCDSVNMHEMCK